MASRLPPPVVGGLPKPSVCEQAAFEGVLPPVPSQWCWVVLCGGRSRRGAGGVVVVCSCPGTTCSVGAAVSTPPFALGSLSYCEQPTIKCPDSPCSIGILTVPGLHWIV
eukprot:3451363-Pyramimonas_sp.AAC.1